VKTTVTIIPSKAIPNLQRSGSKSYLAATGAERGSPHRTLEYQRLNSAPTGNEAFYRWGKGKVVV